MPDQVDAELLAGGTEVHIATARNHRDDKRTGNIDVPTIDAIIVDEWSGVVTR